ncbi:YALIA101S06e08504g1_1 [Yarrowia lipolytica]|jgi:zinc transporter 9|nr:Zinc transporter ZIP9 [Yarrowia lipolytica]SEI35377.1 YALIA101S06e08504g1_1 [Yarrowia lipolytica]
MNGFATILLLSLIMGVAAFVAGLLPVILPLSPAKIRAISALGMGILLGTSLIVIIPEGVETLYNETGEDNGSGAPAVGISLLLGFLIMYLIDNIPLISQIWKGKGNFQRVDVELGEVDTGDAETIVDDSRASTANSTSQSTANSAGQASARATTTGLVIHALADGVAVGSSVSAGNSKLELIIFVAIMIHKAPAAFGLSAVLLRCGLTNGQVKLHLGAFAASTPVGSILTWALIKVIAGDSSGGSTGSGSIHWWTAVLLLFSGGTFLYVAVHVMQELTGEDHGSQAKASEKFTPADLGFSVIGMLIPLLTLFLPDVE